MPWREAASDRSAGLEDGRVAAIVARADTFFIASRSGSPEGAEPGEADVSHRGGRPGFLRREGGSIVRPEYRGNFYFNTLGNLVLDGACGLLIPDFETGDLLHLTGSVEIRWSENAAPDDGLPVNCEVCFQPSRALVRPGAIPAAWASLGRAQAAGRTL